MYILDVHATFLCQIGYGLSKLGRKWTITLLALPMILGFGMLLLADYVDQKGLILAGRIFTGGYNDEMILEWRSVRDETFKQ